MACPAGGQCLPLSHALCLGVLAEPATTACALTHPDASCAADTSNTLLGQTSAAACVPCYTGTADARTSTDYTSLAGAYSCTLPFARTNCASECRSLCMHHVPTAKRCLPWRSALAHRLHASPPPGTYGNEYEPASQQCIACKAGTYRAVNSTSGCLPW